MEAGRGDDDVGIELRAGLEQDAGLGEPLDLVGDDGRLARADALEQVAIRHERDALPPRPVARREMRRHVVVGAEMRANAGDELLLRDLRLLERPAGERVLVMQDLAAHDFVDPRLVDLQFPQQLGELVGIAGGSEIGRRTLQHRDVAHSAAIAGMSVAAVAPEPITTTFLSR